MQRLKPQNVLHKWQKLTKTQRQLTINTKKKSLSDRSNYSQSEASEVPWNNKRYESYTYLLNSINRAWVYS